MTHLLFNFLWSLLQTQSTPSREYRVRRHCAHWSKGSSFPDWDSIFLCRTPRNAAGSAWPDWLFPRLVGWPPERSPVVISDIICGCSWTNKFPADGARVGADEWRTDWLARDINFNNEKTCHITFVFINPSALFMDHYAPQRHHVHWEGAEGCSIRADRFLWTWMPSQFFVAFRDGWPAPHPPDAVYVGWMWIPGTGDSRIFQE